jgi:MFS transporter, CP family, cyanate transporter
MQEALPSRYRWFILAMLTLIGTFVAAIPASCMPPLFKEIAGDLNMNLVDIGLIWGIASLAGLFVSILGGILSDRLNGRIFIGVACVLVGITGAARGLSNSFATLALTVFLNGIVRLVLPVAITKIIGIWFKGRDLGMAQGIGAMGMGFGLMLGPLISGTVLSPWLGGWRHVMYFYGAIAVMMGALWLTYGREPAVSVSPGGSPQRISAGAALSRVLHNKYVWFLGLMLFFRISSLMSLTGYIPTYLKNIGWGEAGADGVLAAFYAVSTLLVVPLSSLSDRMGSRKPVLLVGLIVSAISVGLIPYASGAGVWTLVILSGFLMDSFMAIFTAMLLETEGVGPALSGTAIGVVFTMAQLGSSIFPPIGNRLASFGQQWPFIFWALLGAMALIPFFLVKETGKKRSNFIDAPRLK